MLAIKNGLVQSAEDLSEGGLGVALAEKLIRAQGLGVHASLTKEATIDLFSETQSRYVVSVKPDHTHAFEELCKDAVKIGVVTDKDSLVVNGIDGKEIIREEIDELRKLWKESIKQLLKSK